MGRAALRLKPEPFPFHRITGALHQHAAPGHPPSVLERGGGERRVLGMPPEDFESGRALPGPVEHRIEENQVEDLVRLAREELERVRVPDIDSAGPWPLERRQTRRNQSIDRQALFQADHAAGLTHRVGRHQRVPGEPQGAIEHRITRLECRQIQQAILAHLRLEPLDPKAGHPRAETKCPFPVAEHNLVSFKHQQRINLVQKRPKRSLPSALQKWEAPGMR